MTVYLAPRIQEFWQTGLVQSEALHDRRQSWHPAFQTGSDKNIDYPARASASASN
jgi:hypothetical protein